MKRWLQMAALSLIAAGSSASAQSPDAEKARLEAERARVTELKAAADEALVEAQRAATDAERARSDADRANKQPGRSNFYLGAMVETEGKGADAVKYYSASARDGNCHAAVRLAQLYERGWSTVSRNFAESLRWYHFARQNGCELPLVQSPEPPPSSVQFQHAATLDAAGHGGPAVSAYQRAARSGDCHAAVRLGEIYDKALIGIARDYGESLRWYSFARTLGCDVPLAKTN